MEYTLEIFDNTEIDKFRQAFVKRHPSVDGLTQARREWWCFQNPNGGAFALFSLGDEVAATCYLGGKMLCIGDQATACYEIGETATLPAHQRKGLFSKLVRACNVHAEQSGGQLIYGTPNSQSTPGYAKLDFSIVENHKSWLFLIPSLARWLRFRLPSLSLPSARGLMSELSSDEYIAATASFKRLNVSNPAYLKWRFSDSPTKYRFFRLLAPSGELLCAVRQGELGKYEILTVSEYFLNGTKPALHLAARMLRKLIWKYHDPRRFAGLYLHGSLTKDIFSLKVRLILPHRVLPICAILTGGLAMPDDWFRDFQLSDCDIG